MMAARRYASSRKPRYAPVKPKEEKVPDRGAFVDGAAVVRKGQKTKKEKLRITVEQAFEQNRCICEGCVACLGRKGYPCGQGGLNLQPMCRWCARSHAGGWERRGDFERRRWVADESWW